MFLFILKKAKAFTAPFLLSLVVISSDLFSASLSDFMLFARDTAIINDRTVVQGGFAGANGYGGTYNFKPFICASNVTLIFSAPSDFIAINVQYQIIINNT